MELLFQETDSGSPVLVYGTSYGDIVGWDLRMKGDAFKLENDIKQGKTRQFRERERSSSTQFLSRFRASDISCALPRSVLVRSRHLVWFFDVLGHEVQTSRRPVPPPSRSLDTRTHRSAGSFCPRLSAGVILKAHLHWRTSVWISAGGPADICRRTIMTRRKYH
jgi:hypothetical protein